MSTMPTGDEIDEWVKGRLQDLRIAEPEHSFGDGPLTRTLNVARRNGTPHIPLHCAGAGCLSESGHSIEACRE